jgi:glycosyltransferase involved in cell wall biosynthesis
LAVITIKTLRSMGIDVQLETLEDPDMALITDAYGEGLELGIKKIVKLDPFRGNEGGIYDLTINTHGDMLPYFRKDFTKKNSIVYCHYPAGSCLNRGDPAYHDTIRKLGLTHFSIESADKYFTKLTNAYREMMLNSMVLTNSEFSRKAIFNEFGVDSTVVHPPVDVETFRNASLWSDIRDDSILVVSRFHPSKKLENAIHLARLLKRKGIGKCVKIAGNINPNDATYYRYLKNLVRRYGLQDFIMFEVNVNFGKLLDLMRRTKVYFHPMPGEPFGISTVEAMSAGLVPVVPDTGGHTEFVPKKYRFHTFKQAAEAVAAALSATPSERLQISYSTQKYSSANYVTRFSQIVAEVLDIGKPARPAPAILTSEQMTRSGR